MARRKRNLVGGDIKLAVGGSVAGASGAALLPIAASGGAVAATAAAGAVVLPIVGGLVAGKAIGRLISKKRKKLRKK